MPWFMLLNSTFSVTRVIIVALTHIDGEIFVSHDHNYNHFRILVLYLSDLCFETSLLYCFAFFHLDSLKKVTATLKVQSFFCIWPGMESLDNAADWLNPTELVFILACLRLVVMMPTAARDWWGPTQAVSMSSGLWSWHGGKLIYQFKPSTLLKEPPSG